ncbi:MAG: PIN domain-containing protein [Deltaproteobacteria bacterium]|nr:PIN domain-containing protein [Deltaproteobacteria bacterium]
MAVLMILVDTSVWIDFFRGKQNSKLLSELLLQKQIITHSFVIGELMIGHLGALREKTLEDMLRLPKIENAELEEIQTFVTEESLYGKGLTYIDADLLYSSLTENCLLWTHDKTLKMFAEKYQKAFNQV